jgi:hypothetical protein
MKNKLVVLVATLLGLHSPALLAEAGLWAGVEYLHWEERTTPKVTEKGPIAAVGFNWTQDKVAGLLFAYRGKLYAGTVQYEGSLLFSPSTPVTGNTSYSGMEHEGQLRLRKPKGDYNVEPFIGLGINSWDRELSSFQKEIYNVAYTRAGVEFAPSGKKGLTGGAGVRYALYIDENAYFQNLGYDNNPHLKPKGQLSAFANLGYRINQSFQLSAYYESIKFNDSDPVSVTLNGAFFSHFYQPGSTLNLFGLRLQYLFPLR